MSASTNHKTRSLWLVGVLHAFTHVYHVALMPLYLLIQKDFKLPSVGEATLLVTVQMLSYCAPSYAMGVAADRMNRKYLLGWGLALNAAAFVLLALSPNYATALVAAMLAGVGGSFYHPAATAWVARLCPEATGKALGLVGIGASVGFFAGPIFTGWRATVLEPKLGLAAWREPVLELGLAGLVMAGVFAWLAHYETPPPVHQSNPRSANRIFPTGTLWLLFLAAALAFALRDFTGASMGSLGSLFLQKAHQFDPKVTGLALSALFLASAVSNPLFGHLSDRGRLPWTAGVLVVAAALVVVFPYVPGAWTIPTFAIYGFFFMASYPMVEAALMESVPDAVRGRVFGLFIMVGGLLGNLSHWLVGVWVKHLGPEAFVPSGYYSAYAVLATLLVVSLAGLPALRALRRKEHLDTEVMVGIPNSQSSVVNPKSNFQ